MAFFLIYTYIVNKWQPELKIFWIGYFPFRLLSLMVLFQQEFYSEQYNVKMFSVGLIIYYLHTGSLQLYIEHIKASFLAFTYGQFFGLYMIIAYSI